MVINADVIISLAGVALIAVNLRAAVASVETMLSYGLMKDFTQSAGWSADEGTERLGIHDSNTNGGKHECRSGSGYSAGLNRGEDR